MYACVLSTGCQQNGANSQSSMPWQAPSTASSTSAANQADAAMLADLMKRQAEQSKLSEEQRLELARLTAQYQQKNEQLLVADKQKEQSQQIEERKQIQELTAQTRRQELELQQLESIRRRSLELDSDNRDLYKQLAQSQQQKRLLEDQVKLLRQQMDDAANQLAGIMQAKESADQQVSTLQANLQRRSGATITANSSARRNLTAVEIAGLLVRQDGDVVRIEIPSAKVFQPQTATLNAEAAGLIAQVASSLGQYYPRQVIGIEAHTDNTPVQGANWRSNHQLSAAQAMAVFEELTQSHRFATKQLFVLGHGPNYPVASNDTPDGQNRNRRVEVVVYPETVDQR